MSLTHDGRTEPSGSTGSGDTAVTPPTPGASLADIRLAVDAAAGRTAGTLLLRNARLLDVFTQTVIDTHVLIAGKLIAAVGPSLVDADADEIVDLEGAYLAPGLIDGHVHIESSLVTPSAYATGVLPRGVTGVVCDPHEIGNVAGIPGIEWLLESSEGLPIDVWVTVPSCVPSTLLETSGATLGLPEIEAMLRHPRVVGVAEIMSFPGVIAGETEQLQKALLVEGTGKTAEGHAPAVSGRDLQAYLASGIGSDHEATTLEEGREKLGSGVFLMVREGSVTRNLDALMPLVDPRHADRIGFVTDDRLPHDLLDEGGVDCLVRRSIRAGVEPVYAVRCASYNVARHFRLPRRGAVAAGYFADLVVVGDLSDFRVDRVFKEGREVAAGGRLSGEPTEGGPSVSPERAAAVRNTVRLPPLAAASFRIPSTGGRVRCIRPVPGQVLTEEIVVAPTERGDEVVADPTRDLLKLACLERYGRGGSIGLGLVTGFGLREGALASTVGHDHHNLLAVGADDHSLQAAAERLQELGGGFVAVRGGVVMAELALPIAGLLSDRPLTEVRDALDALELAAYELGCRIPAPFMTLSFLGLAVIPELRLTDHGLVSVNAGELVPFGVETS